MAEIKNSTLKTAYLHMSRKPFREFWSLPTTTVMIRGVNGTRGFNPSHICELLRLAPNLVECLFCGMKTNFDDTSETLALPKLRRLMFREHISHSPNLKASLPMWLLTNCFPSFGGHHHPSRLVLWDESDFPLLAECLRLVPDLGWFELWDTYSPTVKKLFAALAQSTSLLPQLRTLVIQVEEVPPNCHSFWMALLRALVACHTRIQVFHCMVSLCEGPLPGGSGKLTNQLLFLVLVYLYFIGQLDGFHDCNFASVRHLTCLDEFKCLPFHLKPDENGSMDIRAKEGVHTQHSIPEIFAYYECKTKEPSLCTDPRVQKVALLGANVNLFSINNQLPERSENVCRRDFDVEDTELDAAGQHRTRHRLPGGVGDLTRHFDGETEEIVEQGRKVSFSGVGLRVAPKFYAIEEAFNDAGRETEQLEDLNKDHSVIRSANRQRFKQRQRFRSRVTEKVFYLATVSPGGSNRVIQVGDISAKRYGQGKKDGGVAQSKPLLGDGIETLEKNVRRNFQRKACHRVHYFIELALNNTFIMLQLL
ncbi:hypothetical protein DFH08DRAFT_826947 [Mycena albidolilacea]|uniref:Uncharacterized protein n=1 Tax=Mycena albidolilacea TaxID=1033008 RepID=A0AAD6YZY5_9AGAR|nr:hypothetical protein DFH08DRAFT_826947 [Mycena albidolilacea]